MPNSEGEVRDVPFFHNDLKNHASTTGKPVDQSDAPGKADSELIDETEAQRNDASKTGQD